ERLVGAGPAALVRVTGVFDLDHVGAEHAELISRERPGEHVRNVDHPDALERSRHCILPGVVLSLRGVVRLVFYSSAYPGDVDGVRGGFSAGRGHRRNMRAAVMQDDQRPVYATFAEPQPRAGLLVVAMHAAALTGLDRAIARRTHYIKMPAGP